jgi:NAD+ synthase
MRDYRCDEKKVFTPAEECEHIIDWIKEYFVKNGPDSKAIIGISGGKDSTIAAALCVKALGADRVIGILMPQGVQSDIDDARKVCEVLSIRSYEIDIASSCNALYRAIDEGYDYDHCIENNKAVSTNLPARIRMTTLYAMAAELGGRVCNTCNRSEIFVGYSTKYGDRAGDFAPIAKYTVKELLAIGEVLHQEMEIPNELIYKTPSDGMCGATDEDNLGFTYAELDDYILYDIIPANYEIYKKIIQANARNQHKVHDINIPSCRPLNVFGRKYYF